MAECVYETKGDYFNAIDCARRAVGLDENCIEARVIVSRILLETCQVLWSNSQGKVSLDSVVDLEISTVLSTPFKSLSEDGQQIILNLFQSNNNNRCVSGVLLAVFQFMPVQEVTKVCSDMVSLSQTHQPSLILLILSTSHMLLSPVTIAYIAARNSARLNEYRLWLFLDAVATTASIYESMGDIKKTRETGYTLLSAAVQTSSSSDRQRVHFGYGFIADTFDSCRNTILALACRLPLVERSAGMVDEAIGSFHRCVSGSSPLRHYFPIPIQLGLNVEAALTLLTRGKRTQEMAGGVVEYGSTSTSSKPHVLAVTRDIDHAFSLLSTAQQV